MNWLLANKAAVLGCLLALSESLALIPQLKANSVLQLVHDLLMKLKG